MEEVINPVLPSADGQPEPEPAKKPAGVRDYGPWYSPEAIKARDLERRSLVTSIPQPGIGRRVMSWFTNRLGLKSGEEEGHKLTVMEGGNQGSDVRSIRVIAGPREVEQTSGDVARSSIEGLKEPPNNVLQHLRQFPGVTQSPPIDAA